MGPSQCIGQERSKHMRRRTLTLAAVLSGIAARTLAGGPEDPPSAKAGFTAELTATLKTGARDPIVVYREVRAVSASGRKKVVQQQASDGRIVQRFVDPLRGVLVLDANDQLVRATVRAPGKGAVTLGKPSGRAVVLGYEAEVYKQASGGLTTRYYRAPRLNGEVIKVVQETAEST